MFEYAFIVSDPHENIVHVALSRCLNDSDAICKGWSFMDELEFDLPDYDVLVYSLNDQRIVCSLVY